MLTIVIAIVLGYFAIQIALFVLIWIAELFNGR